MLFIPGHNQGARKPMPKAAKGPIAATLCQGAIQASSAKESASCGAQGSNIVGTSTDQNSTVATRASCWLPRNPGPLLSVFVACFSVSIQFLTYSRGGQFGLANRALNHLQPNPSTAP